MTVRVVSPHEKAVGNLTQAQDSILHTELLLKIARECGSKRLDKPWQESFEEFHSILSDVRRTQKFGRRHLGAAAGQRRVEIAQGETGRSEGSADYVIVQSSGLGNERRKVGILLRVGENGREIGHYFERIVEILSLRESKLPFREYVEPLTAEVLVEFHQAIVASRLTSAQRLYAEQQAARSPPRHR